MHNGLTARKAFLEECIDIASVVIHSVCKYLSDQNIGKEVNKRQFLLIGSVVRAVNSAAAIRRLWADRPFAEDMGILLRPLVELVINSFYLQYAPEAEVDCFLSFDTISLAKTIKLMDDIIPTGQQSISPAVRVPYELLAQNMRQEFEGVYSSTSWTKLDLHSRALVVDKETDLPFCAFLSRTAYRHGHSYTHATHRSLEATLDSLSTGNYDSAFTESEAEHNLFATAQTLYACAMLIHHFADFEDQVLLLETCGNLLKTYSESLPTLHPSAEVFPRT